MSAKFGLLLEMMAPMKQMQQDIFTTKEGVAELKSDVWVIKAAVTDLSHKVDKREVQTQELRVA
jgi:hypothetical protein